MNEISGIQNVRWKNGSNKTSEGAGFTDAWVLIFEINR